MLAYCKKCSFRHSRPVGKKCQGNVYPIEIEPVVVSGPTTTNTASCRTAEQRTAPPRATAATSVSWSLGEGAYTSSNIDSQSSHAHQGLAGSTSTALPPQATSHAVYMGTTAAGAAPFQHGMDLSVIQKMMEMTIDKAMAPMKDKFAEMQAKHGESTGSPCRGGDRREKDPEVSRRQAIDRELKSMGLADGDSSSDSDSSPNTTATESDATPRKRRRRRRNDKKGKAYKSGRDMVAEDCGKSRAPWPHHSVFKGPNLRGASYDSLNISEFIFGYLAQMEEPKFEKDAKQMTSYLKDLMEDSKDHPNDWAYIRNFHGYILNQIEKKRVTWRNAGAIEKMRTRYMLSVKAERATARQDRNQVTCSAYNRGDCDKAESHNGMLHVCSHCMEEKNKHHVHPRSNCYSLMGSTQKKKGTA